MSPFSRVDVRTQGIWRVTDRVVHALRHATRVALHAARLELKLPLPTLHRPVSLRRVLQLAGFSMAHLMTKPDC